MIDHTSNSNFESNDSDFEGEFCISEFEIKGSDFTTGVLKLKSDDGISSSDVSESALNLS